MKILLVRLRLIGDVVFTTPVIRALRRHYRDAHIAYLVEPSAAPVVRSNPHLDDVIVAARRRGARRALDDIALGQRLRREQFDIAIDLHGGPRAAWLTWASGAPMRIGYDMPWRSWIYTHRVQRSPDLFPRHSVINQWDLLAPLGIGACTPEHDPVEMIEDTDAARRVRERLEGAGIHDAHRIVVVHVSAGNEFRRWPEEAFCSTIVGLAERDSRCRIIVASGPSDAAAATRVTEAARSKLSRPESLPPLLEWDLNELHALVARAAVYIGGDSGPLHVASTTSTPIVELLGPTLPERSRPWRDPRLGAEMVHAGELPCRPCDQRRCIPGDFRCLTRITPEQVLSAVERVLT
ncbi:MAG TPA: glycosyltransferase family 9 protein [Vicinamibacterales bacterium]